MIKKIIPLKYLILLLILLTGCGGKTILLPAETSQNLLTEETMDQELPDEKSPKSVPGSPDTQEEMPGLAENAQKIKDIAPKQIPKWAFIGKISKEHPNLFRVLTLHTNDMVKSFTIINKNSSKYSEKYLRFLPDGTSVYISKDNELFINKKGGPAPPKVVTVNKNPDNDNETSLPKEKPEEKQSITAPAKEPDEGQKTALNFDNADIYAGALEKYYLQPGDNLDIIFYNTPELDRNVTIRPDGKLSLPPLEEFLASGLTPDQLDKTLTAKYSRELKQPIINVILENSKGHKIYVCGEVNSPMILYLEGKTNALQAIFNAGGFKEDAKLSTVIIVSKSADNQPIARIVDLKKATKGELPESEYLLKPFDMVYVPKSKRAKASPFISHIYELVGLGFTYELHSDENGFN